jgi:hypothetical protein
VQPLLVQDGRDSEARLFDQELLHGVRHFRRLARIVLVTRAGDFADPVRHQLARLRWREEPRLRIVDSAVLPVDRLKLRHFLGGCHAPQQVGHTRVDRQPRITVRRQLSGSLFPTNSGTGQQEADNSEGGRDVLKSHGHARYTDTSTQCPFWHLPPNPSVLCALLCLCALSPTEFARFAPPSHSVFQVWLFGSSTSCAVATALCTRESAVTLTHAWPSTTRARAPATPAGAVRSLLCTASASQARGCPAPRGGHQGLATHGKTGPG